MGANIYILVPSMTVMLFISGSTSVGYSLGLEGENCHPSDEASQTLNMSTQLPQFPPVLAFFSTLLFPPVTSH